MSDSLPEALDLASLTEEQQARVNECVSAVDHALARKDRRAAAAAVWKAIGSALRDNLKASFETFRVEPTDLVLAKVDVDRLTGGAELHQFAVGLKELLPKNAGILIVQNDAQLLTLDEGQMARMGWRKVEDSNPTP